MFLYLQGNEDMDDRRFLTGNQCKQDDNDATSLKFWGKKKQQQTFNLKSYTQQK